MDYILKQKLIDTVKDDSNLYWEDDDAKIDKLVVQSYNYMKKFNDGDELVFDEYSQIAELITERARYSLSNSVDLFELNFAKELQSVIIEIAIDKQKGGI